MMKYQVAIFRAILIYNYTQVVVRALEFGKPFFLDSVMVGFLIRRRHGREDQPPKQKQIKKKREIVQYSLTSNTYRVKIIFISGNRL